MSTFSQWWLSFKKSNTARQITWICGTEPVLVDEVTDLLKGVISTDPINFSYIDAQETTERNVWNALRELPFGGSANKLTIVRGAENLKNDSLFTQYIKDRAYFPRNFVIFISNEEGIRKGENNSGAWEPLEYLKGRGTLVECRPFTAATAKHAVTWVKEKANVRGTIAEYMLNRSTGDLRLVRDTIAKLSVFPGDITLRVVSEMFDARPDDSFLGSLFAMDKKNALLALSEMSISEYNRTLGLVDARLELAGLVHDLLIQRKTSGEIAKAAGNKGFLVPDILPVAKYYDKKRRLRIRNYLATIDEFSDYGVPEGALEALIVLW